MVKESQKAGQVARSHPPRRPPFPLPFSGEERDSVVSRPCCTLPWRHSPGFGLQDLRENVVVFGIRSFGFGQRSVAALGACVCVQVAEHFGRLGKTIGVKVCAIVGGEGIFV